MQTERETGRQTERQSDTKRVGGKESEIMRMRMRARERGEEAAIQKCGGGDGKGETGSAVGCEAGKKAAVMETVLADGGPSFSKRDGEMHKTLLSPRLSLIPDDSIGSIRAESSIL